MYNCDYFLSYLHSVPSEPPQNITVESESSTSIQVDWDPPREIFQFGIIRYYTVRYKVSMNSVGSIVSVNVTDILHRSLLINDLMEFTNYSVEVTAVTIGEGPYSDPVTVVTDQDSKCFCIL